MKNIPILLLCFCIHTALFGNASQYTAGGSGCDTLITTAGQVVLIRIKSDTWSKLQFYHCEDTSGTVYSIQWEQVRKLLRARETAPLDSLSGPGPEKKYTLSDTCDYITLTDGKQYHIRLLDQDKYNYFYMICGDVEDRVYMVPYKRVRSLKKAPKRPDGTKQYSSSGNGCLIVAVAVALGLLALYFIAFLLSA